MTINQKILGSLHSSLRLPRLDPTLLFARMGSAANLVQLDSIPLLEMAKLNI